MEMRCIFSEESTTALKSVMGKENKDLNTHLREVGWMSEKILNRIFISKDLLDYLSTFSINAEMLKEVIALHAYLHDLGKLDKRFQEDKRNNPDSPSYWPHALFSLPLAQMMLESFINKNYSHTDERAKELLLSISLASIATHHSDYHKDLYINYRYEAPEYEKIVGSYKNAYDLMDSSFEYLFRPEFDLRRYMYSLFNGILRISDWVASGEMPIEKTFFEEGEPHWKPVEEYMMTRKQWMLRDYQEYIKTQMFDCGFLRLPTGDGKTETALLPNLPGINKVIYTLPTVTTVEAMRHRFEDGYFGKHNVSFSHHLLFLSLHDEERLEEMKYHEYNINKTVVTTIDRILLALMNYRHYPLLETSLNNAYLIVDEIHSYSPFTLSLILNALEYLKTYHNTRILVMSATLPKLIEEELKNRIGAKEILPASIVEKRYSDKKRVNVHLRPDLLIKKNGSGEYTSDYVNEIYKEFKEKKRKVLVVLNTVDKAKAMYRMLKGEKNLCFEKEIFLMHGRFSQGDKTKKMNFFEKLKGDEFKNRPFVLVSTQVVEVSLDIDFDVLYTEIAPFDALVQRCGRVNRKAEKGVCDVYVFNTESELPYDEKQIKASCSVLADWNFISELDFLDANNEYYEKMRIEYETKLKLKPLSDFNRRLARNYFGEDIIKTRDSTFITVPVIPTGKNDEIFDEIKALLNRWNKLPDKDKNDARAEILKQVLDLPIYTVRDIERKDYDLFDKFGSNFINAEYSFEIGIIPKKKEAFIL